MVLDGDDGAVPAGPAQDRRVHDRVQVDHVGPRAREDRVHLRVGARARVEAGHECGPGTDRARRSSARPDRELDTVAFGELRLHDGEQVLVRASTLAEPVAHVQDAHPAHDAMPAWPGIRPIIRAWRNAARPEATVRDRARGGASRSRSSGSCSASFYAREGREAWKPKAVPFYITSNAFTARAYARTVAGSCATWSRRSAIDRAAPVYLVELAAGSGQFACLFLRRLDELQAQVPGLAGLDLRYVMTDFAQSNVDAWETHERLAPFRDRGRLDFALFDLERDDELRLRRAGVTLGAGRRAQPDGRPGQLRLRLDHAGCVPGEGRGPARATGASPVHAPGARPERSRPPAAHPGPLRPGARSPKHATTTRGSWRSSSATGATTAEASFLLPVGAFRCVRTFEALSGGRLLLLTGDKAVTRDDELAHGGTRASTSTRAAAFSFLVNLHALGATSRRRAAPRCRWTAATSGSRWPR